MVSHASAAGLRVRAAGVGGGRLHAANLAGASLLSAVSAQETTWGRLALGSARRRSIPTSVAGTPGASVSVASNPTENRRTGGRCIESSLGPAGRQHAACPAQRVGWNTKAHERRRAAAEDSRRETHVATRVGRMAGPDRRRSWRGASPMAPMNVATTSAQTR